MALPGWSTDAVPARIAPDALAAWAQLGPAAARAVDAGLVATVDHRVRATLGLASSRDGANTGESVHEQLVGRFTDQFVVDVAAVTAAERDALSRALGAAAFPVVQVMWVADFGTRAEVALRQLFGPAGREVSVVPGSVEAPDLWPAIDAFLVEVARLDQLDPVTTELVRLREARAHNCRLCRSRRLLPAVRAGADESTFDQVDHYEDSDLGERHQVALRLTDAMVWTPARWPSDLADQVRDAFGPAEAVELVLDVTRNSANKIAVALGADAAEVADGELDYFDVGADGQLVSGLRLD